tara:strand:+ start:2394 stop:2774 length:381 start_codon:yes stop_codon:yes gene_type:complete
MSSTYTISIPIMIPSSVDKTYTVQRRSAKNSSYSGDITGIALWFYSQNVDVDNINIIIDGDFHSTYPNPPHLTVEINYDGLTTGKLHMSLNENGYWYPQPIQQPNYGGRKKIKAKKLKTRKSKNTL